MKNGFSLVELSIVLVILGLLAGGILAGKSLIHASELRAVSTEYSRYATASHSFRDKYFGLPGDLINATSFWGEADPSPTTCRTTDSTTLNDPKKTCNGGGNGQITGYEKFRVWQHLANAGLIEGSYTGAQGSGGSNHSILASNVPGSRYTQAGWSLLWRGNYSGDSSYFDGNYGNAFLFGRPSPNSLTDATVLLAEDAYNIDIKNDDGTPGSGKIRSYKNATRPNCVEATDLAYRLSSTTIGCNLFMTTGY